MNDMIPFNFGSHSVRIIVGADGEPWFVAKDVATALGYSNPRDAIGRHCKKAQDVGGSGFATPLGMDPQTTIIPEGDMYRLTMRSKLPGAEEFEALVSEEILPTIRKTGTYNATPTIRIPTTMVEALETALEQCKRAERAEAAMIEAQPKIEGYDFFVAADQENMNLRRGMKVLGAFPNKAIKHLRDRGVLYGTPATPSKYYADKRYFVMEAKPDRNEPEKMRPQTFVTPKGLDWLRKNLPADVFPQEAV